LLITLEEWVDIVALHRSGVPIKAIARQLGISRNAVRRALRRQGPPQRKPRIRASKLDPYKDYLLARLAEFPELSAEALYEEIRARGYDGGRSILKEFTFPYRQPRREPVVRFETPPGKQAQVDWAELGIHSIAGRRLRVHLFVMLLGFSRALYAEATSAADSETFLACHARAFAYFGGMPAEILYDNAKVVVLARTLDGPRFAPALLDFAGRYGFAPRLCRPYRAKTKGKVERSIGYLKDRFLVGRTFTDLEDLNAQLLAWLDGTANRREHHTTGERPIDRLAREGLTPFALAPPWPQPAPASRPERGGAPLLRFAALTVEERSLSAYEQVLS
jgi:transposase